MIKLLKQYKKLYKSDARYFIITGGRGSAKSFHISDYLVKLSYEKNQKILFSRYTLTSAKTSVIPEFTSKIEAYNIEKAFAITQNSIINRYTNSEILFKGLKASSGNQTANLKGIENLSTFVLDEAEELVNEDDFDKIDGSIRTEDATNRVIIVMNPCTTDHFVYQRFFENMGVNPGFCGQVGNVYYIHTTYLDNVRNLSASYLQLIENLKISNYEKYEHLYLGKWISSKEGAVIKNWSFMEDNEFPKHLPVYFGMDFGFSIDPTTLVKVAHCKKTKTLYIDEQLYQKGLFAKDIYPYLPSRFEVIADSADPKTIAELNNFGASVRPVKKKEIIEGLTGLQNYRFVITKRSTNIAKELRNYVWSDKHKNRAIDNYNHAIDAIRYVHDTYIANEFFVY